MVRFDGLFYEMEGARWHGGAAGPYLRQAKLNGGIYQDDIEVYLAARGKLEFLDKTANSGTFDSPFYSGFVLEKSGTGADEIYTLTNSETGDISIFYGFDSAISVELVGRLKETTTRSLVAANESGNVYHYHVASSAPPLESGTVDWVQTTQGWRVQYDYYSSGNDSDRLKSISVYDGPSTTLDTLIQYAEYWYFDTAKNSAGSGITLGSDIGTTGDLVQVRVRRRAAGDSGNNPSDLSIVRTTHYRYKTGSSAHQLKMVFESDAIERLIQDNSNISASEDLLELADSYATGSTAGKAVEAFSSRSFEHYGTSGIATNSPIDTAWPGSDETFSGTSGIYGGSEYEEWDVHPLVIDFWDGAVQSETINGGCSTCGGSGSEGIRREYYYVAIVDFNDWYGNKTGKSNPNQVVRVVIEDTVTVDGTTKTPHYRTLYGVNYYGMTIRTALLEDPTAPSANNIWCTSLILNSDGRIVEQRMPSAHKGMVASNSDLKLFLNPSEDDDSDTETNDEETVNTDSGVVYHFEYDDTTGKRVTGKLVSKGTTTTKYYLAAYDYGDGNEDTAGADHDEATLPIASYSYPSKTLPADRTTGGKKTTLEYTFWDSNDTAVKTIATTLPAISSSQNGSGVETMTYDYYDELGRLRWHKDGEGNVTYYSYHPDTGQLAYQMIDVETDDLPTELTSGSTGKWVAWSGTLPTEFASTDNDNLQLVTKYEYDALGRQTKLIDAGGSEHYTFYFEDGAVQLPFVDGSGDPQAPAEVVLTNDGGVMLERCKVDPSTVDTSLTGLPTTSSNYVSRTVYNYNAVSGQLTQIDRYHDIGGTSGEGVTKQYYGTRFLYDDLGRRGATIQYVENGQFQVEVSLFDVLGRVIETRRGVATTAPTDYGTLANDPIGTPSGFPSSGYATISQTTYDAGSVGDGHITKTKSYFSPSDYTGYNYYQDWRGFLRGIEPFYKNGSSDTPKGPYRIQDVDWMGHAIDSATYSDGATITWTGSGGVVEDEDYVATTASNRNEWTKTHYDDLGRAYRIARYPGTDGTDHFEENNYYDRNGRLICTGDKYSALTEFAYDGAGRQYQKRVVADLNPTSGPYNTSTGAFAYCTPAPAQGYTSMSGTGGSTGTVLEIDHDEYDGTQVIAKHMVEINHDESYGIALSGGAATGGIRTTTFYWYDEADRLSAIANYGSSDGATSYATWEHTSLPSRPSSELDWTDSQVYNGYVLLTKYAYNTAGRQESAIQGVSKNGTNTNKVTTKTFYNDLGQRTYVAENWVNFSPPSTGIGDSSGVGDEDRVTAWEYNGLGNTSKLIAHNGSSEQQETKYSYEDLINASLVTHTVYPDSTSTSSSGTDLVVREYYLDGKLDTLKDQRKVKHTYHYDNRRRLTLDAVDLSSVDSGQNVDPSVLSIQRTYDTKGRLSQIVSYDGSDPGSATVVNKIVYSYYSVKGTLANTKQYHDSTVNYAQVGYASDSSVDGDDVFNDNLRLVRLDYPDGARLAMLRAHATDVYYHGNSIDDRLSRVDGLRFQPAGGSYETKTSYEYNGVNKLVKVDYPVPQIDREVFYSSGDYYHWDQFRRSKVMNWKDSGSSSKAAVSYIYDFAGNRLQRDPTPFDTTSTYQEFQYDGLHRLTQMATKGQFVPDELKEDWTLDQLGNWEEFKHDTDGDGTYADPGDFEQEREHTSKANEISTIDSSSTNVAHDLAGNMVKMPTITGTQSYDALVYDAWNRLVMIENNGNPVQENQYDGLNRRTVRHSDTDDDGDLDSSDEIRHFYYNEEWQVVEERLGSATTADVQYIYHPQYVDSIALRYDANTDEHYYLQDANFNVIAVVDDAGAIDERYDYSPYGDVTYLDSSYAPLTTQASTFDNEYLYTGRRRDPETGLQLNRNRFYAAGLGRWVSRDPIGYDAGTFNLYEYVDSRPTHYVDPGGLQILPPTPKPPINNPRTYPDGGRPTRLGELPPGFPFCFTRGAQWHFKSAGHGCWKTCIERMEHPGCPGVFFDYAVPCTGFRTKLCIYECTLNFGSAGQAIIPYMSWQLIGCINGPCK